MKLRYLNKRCCKCRMSFGYGLEASKKTVGEVLRELGWERIKDRWLCPDCAEAMMKEKK